MPIIKTTDSTWYSKDSKKYTCLKCGNEYYTKYKDYDDKCLFCAMEHEASLKNQTK